MIQSYSYTVTPFQGSTIFATYSQGVALGWYVTALQAYKPYSLPFDLISSALSQINYLFVPPSKWAKLDAWGRIRRTKFEVNFPTLYAMKNGGQ